MRAAYADPPYLGCGKYYADQHPEALAWDRLETHAALIERLSAEYDAWALSLHTPSLRAILPLCPEDVRVMAWVKPFAFYKPSVRVAYAWEPVIVRGGRKRDGGLPVGRDWLAAGVGSDKHNPEEFCGKKPDAFCHWLFRVFGLQPEDEFHDLFPGSGAVTRAYEAWKRQGRLCTPRERATTGDLLGLLE